MLFQKIRPNEILHADFSRSIDAASDFVTESELILE